MISKYDPILKEHIESHKKGSVNDFSHQIQDEFIALLAKKVRNEIIHQIKSAKYYTIMFDCTPDVSGTEQMSQVIRYVHVTDGKVFVEESFLGFIESHEKTSNGLTTEILHQISLDGLDIQNCRGQAYDNGSNMAGKYNGAQAKILEKNQLAIFIPCTAHCLNLAGVNAVGSNKQMQLLFGKIQQLFNFFSGSTLRWEILMKSLKVTLKPFSDTRWSSKAVAVKALYKQLPDVKCALINIIENENLESKPIAKNLLNLVDHEFICLLTVWNSILSSIDCINVFLKKKTITVCQAAKMIFGLIKEITDLRNNRIQILFQDAEQISVKISILMNLLMNGTFLLKINV